MWITKENIREIIELFITWNTLDESRETSIDEAVDYIHSSLSSSDVYSISLTEEERKHLINSIEGSCLPERRVLYDLTKTLENIKKVRNGQSKI